MSLHKLTAGSGYDYLTRQVAALDATDKGHIGLASYYTERGESPGVWVGSGMEGIDGLDVGDPVTAEQMRALFGCGLHPLAELRLQQMDVIGLQHRRRRPLHLPAHPRRRATAPHRRRQPRRNGPRRTVVDLALLEMAANGTALDTGQAALVRHMCSSGARLQLAIAPAGSGKTTAMRALTLAWADDGGQVIGLAPSAAAAAVLGEQTGIRTDTLARLTWSLDHGVLPDWAAAIGPSTLIVIDEAGMADTLSLDAVVQFAIDRGASVRLIGDDQQLAAIGAGGVLRDIKNTHGALQLTSYTASPTRPKHKPPSPCGKAIPTHSASISIKAVFTSVISPRSPIMRSPPGSKIDRPDSTRSCSLRPASSSPSSTTEPAIIALTGMCQMRSWGWRTETGPVPAT
jgi:hypothetical protein